MRRSYYKRKYQKYRRRYKRIRRRTRVSKRTLRRISRVVNFRRNTATTATQIQPGASSTPYIGALDFQVQSLIDITQVLATFQEYRVNCLVVTFLPTANTTDAANQTLGVTSTSNSYMPMIGWCFDKNDATVPANLNLMQVFDTYRERQFNRPVRIKVWPYQLTGLFNAAFGGLPAYAGVTKAGWTRCASPDVRHYGMKWVIYGLYPNQPYTFQYRVTAYLSFRDVF